LYARLDRKPIKSVEKKLKKYFSNHKKWLQEGKQGDEPTYNLNYKTDLKPVHESWIPAKSVQFDNENLPIPDKNGHTPGWVPISTDSKQYCWHHAVVEHDNLLLLQPLNGDELEITDLPFNQLQGGTYELIGTNINANPYG